MKKTSRILTVLLAFVMVVSMSSVAFAKNDKNNGKQKNNPVVEKVIVETPATVEEAAPTEEEFIADTIEEIQAVLAEEGIVESEVDAVALSENLANIAKEDVEEVAKVEAQEKVSFGKDFFFMPFSFLRDATNESLWNTFTALRSGFSQNYKAGKGSIMLKGVDATCTRDGFKTAFINGKCVTDTDDKGIHIYSSNSLKDKHMIKDFRGNSTLNAWRNWAMFGEGKLHATGHDYKLVWVKGGHHHRTFFYRCENCGRMFSTQHWLGWHFNTK